MGSLFVVGFADTKWDARVLGERPPGCVPGRNRAMQRCALDSLSNNEAIILRDAERTGEDEHIAKMLDFFGVTWRRLTPRQFLDSAYNNPVGTNFCLLGSADCLTQLFAAPEREVEQLWRTRVHSAFVHASDDRTALQTLAQNLVQSGRVGTQALDSSSREPFITFKRREFCGVMSGLRVSLLNNVGGFGFLFTPSLPQNAIELASVGRMVTFLRIDDKGVPVYMSASPEIVDISAELDGRNFDVREHVLSAVPIVLYVKWAFAKTCWYAPEANACLVIDDPLLKPSYGFVNYAKLLSLMDRHRFSTNIAFIPWNW